MSEFAKYLNKRLQDPAVRAGFDAKCREYAHDDLRAKLTEALASHHVECVMTAPNSFGWHCLTCGAEFHSWSTIEAAEQASLAHHADTLMPVIREAMNERGNSAGCSHIGFRCKEGDD